MTEYWVDTINLVQGIFYWVFHVLGIVFFVVAIKKCAK
jgi:hypothetical protein